MKTQKVLIKPNCLDMIIASAVEVCPRETNGLLIGRLLNGTIRVKTAYPFLTDNRKPSFVEHGNISAMNRLFGTLSTMKKPLIGGYHSHPYPNGNIKLTKSDMDFIEEELGRLGKFGQLGGMERWVELVLSVKRKDYEKLPATGRYFYNGNGNIRVAVRMGNYTGFDVKIAGYVLGMNGGGLEKNRAELHLIN